MPDAGWYPDPSDHGLDRFWDGRMWTPDTRPSAGDPKGYDNASARAVGGTGVLPAPNGRGFSRRRNWTPAVVGVGIGAAVVAVVVVLLMSSGADHDGIAKNQVHTRAPTSATTDMTGGVTTSNTLDGTSTDSSTTTTPSLVRIDDSVVAPEADAVRSSLDEYFSAVNNRDWQLAWSHLAPAEQQAVSQAQLAEGASTTSDSDVVIDGVSPLSSSTILVTVRFRSTQAPAQSPDGSSCDTWHLAYTMVNAGSGWLIAKVHPAESGSGYESC